MQSDKDFSIDQTHSNILKIKRKNDFVEEYSAENILDGIYGSIIILIVFIYFFIFIFL